MSAVMDDEEVLHHIFNNAQDMGSSGWVYTRDQVKEMSVQLVTMKAWLDSEVAPDGGDSAVPEIEEYDTHEPDDGRRFFG